VTPPIAGGAQWSLQCTVIALEGVTLLVPAGVLDSATASVLQVALQPAVDDGRRIVVDLSKVEAIDASGVRVLEAAQHGDEEAGFQVMLAAPPERIRRLIETFRLSRALPVFPSVEAALKSVRPAGQRPAG